MGRPAIDRPRKFSPAVVMFLNGVGMGDDGAAVPQDVLPAPDLEVREARKRLAQD